MAHRSDPIPGFSAEKQWKHFHEYCDLEIRGGGPDPHLRLVGHMSKDLPLGEKLWRGGLYVGTYNVPTAEIIWRHWTHDRMFEEDVQPWLEEHWKGGFNFHRYRKCVRNGPQHLARFMNEYADWAESLLFENERFFDEDYKDPIERYNEIWDLSQKSVTFLGRYSGFKLLEFYRRYCDMPIELPDIRPKDGWSPRVMLSLLEPAHRDVLLLEKDTPESISEVNRIADAAIYKMEGEFGLKIDRYLMQVLLCDYKQSVMGKKQYPGKPHDSELQYYAKIADYWPEHEPEEFKARLEIVPHECLGELHGWDGPRKECLGTLREYGYLWSDLLYDYNATKESGDFSAPVMRRGYVS